MGKARMTAVATEVAAAVREVAAEAIVVVEVATKEATKASVLKVINKIETLKTKMQDLVTPGNVIIKAKVDNVTSTKQSMKKILAKLKQLVRLSLSRKKSRLTNNNRKRPRSLDRTPGLALQQLDLILSQMRGQEALIRSQNNSKRNNQPQKMQKSIIQSNLRRRKAHQRNSRQRHLKLLRKNPRGPSQLRSQTWQILERIPEIRSQWCPLRETSRKDQSKATLAADPGGLSRSSS